ncbi:hypothetical protein [Streptomyces europaeiscabiei]|uniref:hypothetical protein n=1 Tax=Streptomyces europaeiscabiei TaxID=146819 RepID=UPI0029B932BE|nr:hypothetical protein [Streptomyces europaeiscabiei]MDX3587301.1 hypothetical protein [Streptomyces europaeiscabiei]MDX3634365.1 hypothetical protein [Streptomyces europaeiscabiei]MDX3651787.1 hypothetical protein [Streptomyces europaeiscabiei]
MATVLQTSSGVRPLHDSPQAWTDREGDTWVPSGRTPSGDVLLACPQPLNPEDAGVGESFAWTWRLVETAFGPLKPVSL